MSLHDFLVSVSCILFYLF